MGALIGAFFLIWIFSSCAQTHKPSKQGAAAIHSTAAVKASVEAAKKNIQDAAVAAKAAGQDNSDLKSLAQRLDDKSVIIDRWLSQPQ